jgi:hypothetical protein
MATIINNPRPDVVERTTTIERDGGAGWGVAVIVILLVAGVSVYLWVQHHHGVLYATPANSTTNVSAALPGSSNNASGVTPSASVTY